VFSGGSDRDILKFQYQCVLIEEREITEERRGDNVREVMEEREREREILWAAPSYQLRSFIYSLISSFSRPFSFFF
jgi:hypothetical protein